MYFKDALIGIIGIGLTSLSMESLTTWAGIICSIAITLATCGIQIYRMIRDRDTDKTNNDKKE